MPLRSCALHLFSRSLVRLIGCFGSRRVTDRIAIHDELNAAISLAPLRRIIGGYGLGFPEPA